MHTYKANATNWKYILISFCPIAYKDLFVHFNNGKEDKIKYLSWNPVVKHIFIHSLYLNE